jgi:hypothetical protein
VSFLPGRIATTAPATLAPAAAGATPPR